MNQSSTQQQIEIAGIKNGVVIMKDLSYRVVLQVASINFNLKSEMEQNSIIFQYQSFLNSLHFPIQIVVRSKRLDLTPYLNHLKEIGNKQENELVRSQTLDYVNFVGQLIDIANIMKKDFYVVVPYTPINVGSAGFLDNIFKIRKEGPSNLKISEKEFKDNVTKLMERANIVASGIGSMGLRCIQMNTEQLIELFYGVYNPTEAGRERLTDFTNISASTVRGGKNVPDKQSQSELIEYGMIDNSAQLEEQKKRAIAEKQAKIDQQGQQPGQVEQFKTPDFLNQEKEAATTKDKSSILSQNADTTAANPKISPQDQNQPVPVQSSDEPPSTLPPQQ